jgi:hypothetical protein
VTAGSSSVCEVYCLPIARASPTISTMDLPPAWCEVCLCGRTFSSPQAYSCHKRGCEKTKKRLSGALEKAKEIWQAKKRQKTEANPSNEISAGPSNLETTPQPVSNATSTQEVSHLSKIRSPHDLNHCPPGHRRLSSRGLWRPGSSSYGL